jgi:hypothetical protein
MLSLDAFDTDAQLVIAQFLNVGWFSLDDVCNYVARVPTARGADRTQRRRDAQDA